MLHLLVSVNVLVFSDAEKNVGRGFAVVLSNRLGNVELVVVGCTFLVVAVAFLSLFIAIMRGNTCLKKRAVFFSPVVPMAVVLAASQVLPKSAFSYGLYTFNMNAGMIVWFMYLLEKGEQDGYKN